MIVLVLMFFDFVSYNKDRREYPTFLQIKQCMLNLN